MDAKGVTGVPFKIQPMRFEQLFENGSKRNLGMLSPGRDGIILNLGCGEFKLPPDIEHHDLQEPDWKAPYLDFDAETVGVIHAYHFLEHLTGDEVKEMLHECSRVMKDRAVMNICVPYARADIAFQDIDHKTFFTEESWITLLANPYYDTQAGELEHLGASLIVRFNIIAGVVGRNLSIYTQLERAQRGN